MLQIKIRYRWLKYHFVALNYIVCREVDKDMQSVWDYAIEYQNNLS